MKFMIPAAAILIAAAAFLVRDSRSGAVEKDLALETPDASVRTEAGKASHPTAEATSAPAFVRRSRTVRPEPNPSAGASDRRSAPRMERLVLRTLQSKLDLTPLQRDRIEEVLRLREERIDRYHGELRESNVFNPRQYDLRTGAIRNESYRQIDALLDGEQSREFAKLLDGNRLGDATAFALEPGMIVVK